MENRWFRLGDPWRYPAESNAMNWISNRFSSGIASGRWTGTYEQHGRSFPIEASFKHRGNRLYGTMLDVDGTYRQPLQTVLEESNLSISEIKQFIAEVRSQFPDSLDGDIEYRSYLPKKSLIKGKVNEKRISFIKRYEGCQQIEYVLNDLALPQSVQCELVEYTGALAFDSDTISGDWSITSALEPEVKTSGTFQLTR